MYAPDMHACLVHMSSAHMSTLQGSFYVTDLACVCMPACMQNEKCVMSSTRHTHVLVKFKLSCTVNVFHYSMLPFCNRLCLHTKKPFMRESYVPGIKPWTLMPSEELTGRFVWRLMKYSTI